MSLWDLSDRAAPRRIGEPLTHPFGDFRPVLSSDGRTLATSGGEGILILWDLSDRAAPRRLGKPLANPNGLVAAVFSSDGQTLATGEGDTVSLWDLSDRAAPRRLGAPLSVPLTGDFFGVRAVDFSEGWADAHDSRPGHGDLVGSVRPGRPRPLGEPLTHTSWVNAVAFSPDARTLAASADDGTVLWDLTNLNDVREHATEYACAITGQGLNRVEWARYIRGLPHQSTCSSG